MSTLVLLYNVVYVVWIFIEPVVSLYILLFLKLIFAY